ncbi:transcriptional regulator [Sinorhizobium meliloti]|uniref:transposase n=1 Tax=Rhizobium meliloti TaxID=382 RepID=UPI000FD7AC2E|nr:transposase [Sinorhizobium meliloti]RVP14363.1 transcriptional regulator [Sinorhizobium meliloti]
MVDESNAGPVGPAVLADAEVKAPAGKKRSSSRPQKAPPEPEPKMRAAKRRYTEQERSEKLRLIETQVSKGITQKNAIKSASISEQTYYHWKGADKSAAQKDLERTGPLLVGDEFAELVQLDEENKRLRKQLGEKLRTENADLRKRLGLG